MMSDPARESRDPIIAGGLDHQNTWLELQIGKNNAPEMEIGNGILVSQNAAKASFEFMLLYPKILHLAACMRRKKDDVHSAEKLAGFPSGCHYINKETVPPIDSNGVRIEMMETDSQHSDLYKISYKGADYCLKVSQRKCGNLHYEMQAIQDLQLEANEDLKKIGVVVGDVLFANARMAFMPYYNGESSALYYSGDKRSVPVPGSGISSDQNPEEIWDENFAYINNKVSQADAILSQAISRLRITNPDLWDPNISDIDSGFQYGRKPRLDLADGFQINTGNVIILADGTFVIIDPLYPSIPFRGPLKKPRIESDE